MHSACVCIAGSSGCQSSAEADLFPKLAFLLLKSFLGKVMQTLRTGYQKRLQGRSESSKQAGECFVSYKSTLKCRTSVF